MGGFDYTVKSGDKGLTYIFLEEAKKYKGFDSSKVDWNSVMQTLDEIQAEKQKSGGSIFKGSTDKTRAGWGSSYQIHADDKIELTEEQMNKIYSAMGVDVSKGKKEVSNAGGGTAPAGGGNPSGKKQPPEPGVPTGMRKTAQDGVFYDEETKKHYKRDESGQLVELEPRNGGAVTQVNADGSHFERYDNPSKSYNTYHVGADGKNKFSAYYNANKQKEEESVYDEQERKILRRSYKNGKLEQYARYDYYSNGVTKSWTLYNSNKKRIESGYYDDTGNYTGGENAVETWTVKNINDEKQVYTVTDRKTKQVHYEIQDADGNWVKCDKDGNIIHAPKVGKFTKMYMSGQGIL